jgi:lambda family phage portal protein
MGAQPRKFDWLLSDGTPLSDAPPAGTLRVVPAGGRTSMIAGDSYEGASQISAELARWLPALRSADLDVNSGYRTADARTRDTMRNDAHVQGGVDLQKDGVVGAQYMLNAKPSSKLIFGKEDPTWETEAQEEFEEKFTTFAESPENWIDASRQNSFTSLIRMGVGNDAIYGNDLSTVEWMRDWAPLRPFSTAIQSVDTDRLSTPPEFLGDLNVRMGIRRDSYGAPQGYYIRVAHPSEIRDPNSQTWKYVQARKPWGRLQVIHIFEQTRADQSRGMARLVAALKEMRMTKKFRDIVLQKAVHNATYAATIESDMPTAEIFARLGGGDMTPDAVSAALSAYMAGHFTTLDSFMGNARNLQIDNVKIPHLPPGAKLQLRDTGQGGPLGGEFEQSLLRYLAVALGVSYEELSKDFSNTNYSSGRMAIVMTDKAMKSRKRIIADRKATSIYRLWFEECFNNNLFESLKISNRPSIYEGQNFDALTLCDWVGASRGQVDELKETQAAALRISSGISTFEDELAKLGKDWRKVFRQIKRENELKKFYDILQEPVDTSSMTNAATGATRDKSGKKKASALDEAEAI